MGRRITVYDATLREGAQCSRVSFSMDAKLKLAHLLDELGVSYIEAGNPGSNVKDALFYQHIREQPLQQARLVAFGSTCRAGVSPERDGNLRALLEAQTPAVALFGKSWDLHVTDVLHTTYEENLRMIRESVGFMKEHGKEVFFDAEHFFDGWKNNMAYALRAVEVAREAGADHICLCDTNGGCFPSFIAEVVSFMRERYELPVGIHCHNDCDMATANTVAAVLAGADMAQVTMNGYGERCGNADLFRVVPNLQLKKGLDCLPAESMKKLADAAQLAADQACVNLNEMTPYVGRAAFSHKAGMHIDAVNKNSHTFEHIDPSEVGAKRHFLLSEVAGRDAVLHKIRKFAPRLQKSSPETAQIMELLKKQESLGYQYEAARASFELLVKRFLGMYERRFEAADFHVEVDADSQGRERAIATVTLLVDGQRFLSTEEGEGPVSAIDNAMRRGLEYFFPALRDVYLEDFRVKVLDSSAATGAPVCVIIESSDGSRRWATAGVSTNVLVASWQALIDSFDYKLLKSD